MGTAVATGRWAMLHDPLASSVAPSACSGGLDIVQAIQRAQAPGEICAELLSNSVVVLYLLLVDVAVAVLVGVVDLLDI